MVYINSMRFTNLYSYEGEHHIELEKNNVIVGPNNSGKSNIFRIIRVLQQTFTSNHELVDSEIFPKMTNVFLEANIVLSESEAVMIVKHLSFYPIEQNNVSRFYEFHNLKKITDMFKKVIVRLTWKKSLRRGGYEPFIELRFTEIGLIFSGQYWPSYFMISNKFSKSESYPYIEKVRLHEFLDNIADSNSPKDEVNKLFSEVNEGKFLKVEAIKRDTNYEMPDKGREFFQDIIKFLGISEDSNSDISLFQIIGKILENGIKTTRGGLNLKQNTNADLAQRMRFDVAPYPNSVDPEKQLFNQMLETQALKKDLEFVINLNEDGSNIAQYLFGLRNSPNLEERKKYQTIKKIFEDICSSENLEFDIILDYAIEKKSTYRGIELISEPKFPRIVFTNKNTGMHYSIDKIGTGISEILYLLTTSYGLDEKTILMDEPSVNLHPPKTKELMMKISQYNSKNQFITVTHSPDLAHLLVFDNNADIFYVRKINGSSKIFAMKKEQKIVFDQDRGRLKHQIDSRVFFGKGVILCEGESDRNLLGITDYLKSIDGEYDLSSKDILITSIGGHSNFPKYVALLSSLEIPFLILADIHAKKFLPESYAIMTKDGIEGNSNVVVIDGDLEDLMNQIDIDLYSKIKAEVGKSKPTVAFEFAKRISEKNPNALNSIKSLVSRAIEISEN